MPSSTATAWSRHDNPTSKLCFEEALFRSVYDERGEPAGEACARVDIDAIRHHLRFGGGGVAVDDNFLIEPGMVQEGIPDPDQIVTALLLERYARPHAGMAEDGKPLAEQLQELGAQLDWVREYL